jgi:hypothetical protein
VAIREPLLEAVSAEPTVKADGGVTVEEGEANNSDERLSSVDGRSSLLTVLQGWI